jgi:hypothetical protein
VAATPQETLADEHRRRIPAAVAAVAAGILSLVGSIVAIASSSDIPSVHLVRALNERLSTNPPQPSLKAREVLYLNDHLVALVLPAVIVAVTTALIAFALAYLYRATYDRRPEIGRVPVVALIAGAVVTIVPGLVNIVGLALEAHSFAGASEQTAAAARDALEAPVVTTAGSLREIGSLIFGVGIALVAWRAMSVGLLTRFMGVLGIIVGVISTPLFPLGRSLPFVQMVWLIALGMLFVHRWSGAQGLPPAWTTGEAHPWPSQQELREARIARIDAKAAAPGEADDESSGGGSPNGKARSRPAVPETPAPEVPARPAHPSSKKKKRKRR